MGERLRNLLLKVLYQFEVSYSFYVERTSSTRLIILSKRSTQLFVP
jgi:hypothetical protein